MLSPQDAPHIITAFAIKTAQVEACVSIQGSHARGAFDAHDRRLYERVLPHLARALLIKQRLDEQAARSDMLADAFDRTTLGVLLLDTAGRVLHASAIAREMLAAGDGLALREGALWCTSSRSRQRLSAGLRSADASGNALTVSLERSPRPPYTMHLFRPRGTSAHRLPVAVAWVAIVVDPVRMASAPAERLQRMLGCTPAEAAVVSRLLAGDSLATAAQTLGRSLETARSQLKAVFRKSGCRTQADLIRTVLARNVGLTDG